MADNTKTFMRLFKLYGRMDLLWFLRDTKYCLLYMLTDLISILCSMCGIFLLSAKFGGFGGMTRPEIFFMLGFSTLVDGIYMLFFMGNNTSMISRIIGRGQLDHIIVQPAPLWMILLSQGFSPVSANSTLICGMIMTGYALSQLTLTVTPLLVLLLSINALASCLIIVAVMYLISCLAFYAPAAAEEIAQSGLDLFAVKTYPLGSLSARTAVLFSTVIPVGMTAWFPSSALLQYGYGSRDSVTIISLMAAPAMAALLMIITTLVFQKGMRHYETCGSPRYSSFGHR